MAAGNPDTRLKFCQNLVHLQNHVQKLLGFIFSCGFQVLVIRHSTVTFLSTDDDETSPTIQDGGRQTGSSPHCTAAAMLNFTQISMKLQDIRYCIVTATPENMVVAFEIKFLRAIGQKL